MSDFSSSTRQPLASGLSASAASLFSKQFVSEKTIEEQKKDKQDDELPYDPRPLHEKLREKKLLAEEEYKEKMRFANQIRGLDSEEADFLAHQARLEKQRLESIRSQEKNELEEFRKLASKAVVEASAPVISSVSSNNAASVKDTSVITKSKPKDKQREILGMVVKRKASKSSESDSKYTNVEEQSSKKLKTESSYTKDTSREASTKTTNSHKTSKITPLVADYGSDSSDD